MTRTLANPIVALLLTLIPGLARSSVTGLVLHGGKPLARARVEAYLIETESNFRARLLSAAPQPIPLASATTNPDGKFALPVRDPRVLRIVAKAAGFSPDSVLAFDGDTVELELASAAVMTGRVSSSGTTVPDARVAVIAADGAEITVSTDATGAFSVPDPRTWAVRMVIAHPRYEVLDRRRFDSTDLELIPGAPLMSRQGGSSTVEGMILTKTPISGALISLRRNDQLFEALSDATGRYRIDGLSSGSFRLSSTIPHHALTPIDVAVDGQSAVTKDLKPEPLASISLTLVDDQRKAVVGALIECVSPSPICAKRSWRRSDARGQWSANDLPAQGRVALLVHSDDHVPLLVEPFALAAGEAKELSVTLRRGIEVTGRVVDDQGRPLPDVKLFASAGPLDFVKLADADAPHELVATSKPDGSFRFRREPGPHEIIAYRNGYVPQRIVESDPGARRSPLVVTLRSSASAEGQVLRGGSPVGGVTVSVQGRAFPTRPVVTGADGRFKLTNLPEEDLLLEIRSNSEPVFETIRVTPPALDLVVELPSGRTLRGKVVEKGSQTPVRDYRLRFEKISTSSVTLGNSTQIVRRVQSPEGEFEITNVESDNYKLTVVASGYAPARLAPLHVTEETADLVVEMGRGSVVAGTVVDSESRPLADVLVELADEQSDGLSRFDPIRVKTNAQGVFEITAAPAGLAAVRFRKEGYLTFVKPIVLTDRPERVEAQLARGHTLEGIAVNEAGSPLANVSVAAFSAAQHAEPRQAKTAATGKFSLTGLAPVRYRIIASLKGFAPAKLDDVDVSTSSPIRFVLLRGGVVEGIVSGIDRSHFGSVTVRAEATGGEVRSAVDPGGHFEFAGLAGDSVSLTAVYETPFAYRSTPLKRVELPNGKPATVELVFRNDIIIRGRVTRQGLPLASSAVVFSPASLGVTTRAWSMTDADGAYEIGGIQAGTYNVRVVESDRLAFEANYPANGPGTYDIRIAGARLWGRAFDRDSSDPLAGVSISLQKAENVDPYASRSAMTDASGNFSIDGISPGKYIFRALRDRYAQRVADLTLEEGEAVESNVAMSRDDGIIVRVIDARTKKPIRAEIWVRDDNRVTSYQGQPEPDAEGKVHLPIGRGFYNISVGISGYAPRLIKTSSSDYDLTVAMTPGGRIVIRSSVKRRVRLSLDGIGTYLPSFYQRPDLLLDPGSLTLENIPPGRARLRILDENGNEVDVKAFIVIEGETVHVDV